MRGKPEFTGVGTLVLRVSLFLNPERAQDVQPKFAYEIVATSNCRLRQNVVCADLPNVVLPRVGVPEVRAIVGTCTRGGALTTSLIQGRSVEIRSHSAGGFGESKEVHA